MSDDTVLYHEDGLVGVITLNRPSVLNAVDHAMVTRLAACLDRARDSGMRALVITGAGRASKEQMQHAVARELGLAKLPEPHDVADALAIALCHYFAGNGPLRGPRSATFTGVNEAALLGTDPDVIDEEN